MSKAKKYSKLPTQIPPVPMKSSLKLVPGFLAAGFRTVERESFPQNLVRCHISLIA